MCETKAILVPLSLILLVAASFYIYQAHRKKRVGRHIEIKSQSVCQNEYKKLCLNGGESYYSVHEIFLGSNFSCLVGTKRCEEYMWWNQVGF